MTLMIPNNAEGDVAQYFVNKASPQDIVLRLFQNNITPAETDTASTYTEATFTGYAAIQLAGATWGAPSEGAPTSISYAQQTFASSSAQATQQIYGAYGTRVTSGRIALAERFADGPYPIANNGDTIKVTPTITFD